jgi:hypothetical protein
MTKEEILKSIEKGEVNITKLNKNSSYIILVEVGNTSKEQIDAILTYLADRLEKIQIKHFVIVPTYNGIPSFKFYEFKDNKVSEVE